MRKVDLVLLHAPSVYDFRERPTLFGPVSDVVPSSQVFDMYPIGFLTMLEYLQRHGHSVRVVNVALKMLRSRRFNVDKLIKSLKPRAFGLDLHWMVHAQGSLEIAAIVKKHHPAIPVIFGGLSASYFHEELITYPQVDYVVRGDSTEEPLRQLIDSIKSGSVPRDVPNLTWKEGSELHVSEISNVPSGLDDLSFDYRQIMRSCARHWDIFGHLPFRAWSRYPIVAALSCRGCVHNCPICGGSASAYRNFCGRSAPAYRSPEVMAKDMALSGRYINGPIIVLGDITQSGRAYASEFLAEVKRHKIKNHVALEFFVPPSRELLQEIADAVPRFNIQISPESHNESVRRTFGRTYGNEQFEESMLYALELGCKRIDVFFMIGIPEQTTQSVKETIDYCEELLMKSKRAGHGGKLHPYISPLAPFLDPGSRAFTEPEKHGYRLVHRTLEEHRKALLAPSWKYTLNYETEWMTRDELVDVTYEAALALNKLKEVYGLENAKTTEQVAERILKERELLGKIDSVYVDSAEPERSEKVRELMLQFDAIKGATICRKEEMNWPASFVRVSPLRILQSLLPSRKTS